MPRVPRLPGQGHVVDGRADRDGWPPPGPRGQGRAGEKDEGRRDDERTLEHASQAGHLDENTSGCELKRKGGSDSLSL